VSFPASRRYKSSRLDAARHTFALRSSSHSKLQNVLIKAQAHAPFFIIAYRPRLVRSSRQQTTFPCETPSRDTSRADCEPMFRARLRGRKHIERTRSGYAKCSRSLLKIGPCSDRTSVNLAIIAVLFAGIDALSGQASTPTLVAAAIASAAVVRAIEPGARREN